jgi:SHS2 domain-containing protein
VARSPPLLALDGGDERVRPLLLSWETFEHEADVGLIVRGADGPELFATAGVALFELVCRLDAVEERERYELASEADGVEALLVDWINDLVYLFEGEGVVCRRFAFQTWSPTSYRAEAFGEPVDAARHDPRDLVKAATYHGLSVQELPGRWEARVILDV